MLANKKIITRLLQYKDVLARLKTLGFIKIFSDNIADASGTIPAQVRKDFSIYGISGSKRGGYNIDDLILELNKILGKDKITNVIVVGAGNIGTALIKYKLFEKENIKIIAGFDIDAKKINERAATPILHLDKMAEFIQQKNIRVAIITTPQVAAQHIADILVGAGIKGILNFSPAQLKSPEEVIIQNIHLQTELESLIYFVNAAKKERPE